MPLDWKVAIVRVTSNAEAIRDAVIRRVSEGWLLDSQFADAATGTTDLVFRHAAAR